MDLRCRKQYEFEQNAGEVISIYRASGTMHFSQQFIYYFLVNYAPKIPNYSQIMQIAHYCTIFLSENV